MESENVKTLAHTNKRLIYRIFQSPFKPSLHLNLTQTFKSPVVLSTPDSVDSVHSDFKIYIFV